MDIFSALVGILSALEHLSQRSWSRTKKERIRSAVSSLADIASEIKRMNSWQEASSVTTTLMSRDLCFSIEFMKYRTLVENDSEFLDKHRAKILKEFNRALTVGAIPRLRATRGADYPLPGVEHLSYGKTSWPGDVAHNFDKCLRMFRSGDAEATTAINELEEFIIGIKSLNIISNKALKKFVDDQKDHSREFVSKLAEVQQNA